VLAGLLAGAVGVWGAELPAPLLLLLVFLAPLVGAALWALLAGVLRARLGVHEVIGTILLNYVAFRAVEWLLRIESFGLLPGMQPRMPDVPDAVRLGEAIPGTGVGVGLMLAVALALVADFLLFRSKPGFALRAWGGNPEAARAAGIRPGRTIVLAMVLGSVCASFAGTTSVLGAHGAYLEDFSPGYGFTGIAVALLAGNRPAGVVLAALFFAVLRSGAFAMDALGRIPREAVGLIEVLVIVLVAAERLRARPGRKASP